MFFSNCSGGGRRWNGWLLQMSPELIKTTVEEDFLVIFRNVKNKLLIAGSNGSSLEKKWESVGSH